VCHHYVTELRVFPKSDAPSVRGRVSESDIAKALKALECRCDPEVFNLVFRSGKDSPRRKSPPSEWPVRVIKELGSSASVCLRNSVAKNADVVSSEVREPLAKE
jgi:hypothetical protein